MAILATMPPIIIDTADLLPFGQAWTANGGNLSKTPPNSSLQLGEMFDKKVGAALAIMLGNIQCSVTSSIEFSVQYHFQ